MAIKVIGTLAFISNAIYIQHKKMVLVAHRCPGKHSDKR